MIKRILIDYFEGTNTLVSSNISKKEELSYTENARSLTIGTIEKRGGTNKLGGDLAVTANYGTFFFENSTTLGFYRFSKVGGANGIYYKAVDESWTILTDLGSGVAFNTTNQISTTIAEGCCFMAIGSTTSSYIASNGTTVYGTYISAGHWSHLKNAPNANNINFYKDKLYVADYYNGGTRYKNKIQMSSYPLGIATLVEGDYSTSTENTTTDLDATSQFTITKTSGTIFRYTWTGVGTNPNIGTHITEGCSVVINGFFFAVNNGTFNVNNVSTDWFEVDNPSPGLIEIPITSITIAITTTTPITSLNVTDTKCIYADVAEPDTLQIYRSSTLITGTTDCGATSQFDVTAIIPGSRYRYTWDGVGKNPRIGTYIALGATVVLTGFSVANSGTFAITAVAADWFEITNTTVGAAAQSNVIGVTIVINTISVTAKTNNIITIFPFKTSISSADELWVNDSYGSGTKMFRWVNNAPSGNTVKEYDTFKLSGGQNDAITVLTNIGNVMMVGNKRNLSVWNDYALQNFDLNIGCASKRGWVKSMGALWFVDYSGIYSTTGSTPKLMSSKVEKYIEGATKAGLEASAAGKKGLSVFFSIGDVTLYNPDGSISNSLSGVVLEYNIRQENWYTHTGIKTTQFTTYIESTNSDRLEFTSTVSPYNIYEFLSTETDSGSEILFRMDTGNITLNKNFENYSYPREIIVETERGNGITCWVSLDNEPFYQIKGDIVKGCTVLPIHNRIGKTDTPRCRQIKISLRDYTPKLCKISRLAITFSETLEEQTFKEFENG